jgi:hypothetical protein
VGGTSPGEVTVVGWLAGGPPATQTSGTVGEVFRIVTLGWAQMLLHLKQCLDSGQPTPFFSF